MDVLISHLNFQVDLFYALQITPVHELRNTEEIKRGQLANNSTLGNEVGLFSTVKSSSPLTHNP